MKIRKILTLLFLSTLTTNSIAKDLSFSSKSTTKIQQQIIEAEALIERVGREKISDLYFLRLRESKAELAQFKASADKNKRSLVEINELYFNIDNLLNPENIKKNKKILTELGSSTKGVSDGVIRGLVRGSNGDVVSSGSVRLYNSSGNQVGYDNVDMSGRYLFNNLSAGQYVMVFDPSYNSSFIDTAYPSIPCPSGLGYGCQISDLSLTNIVNGQVLENINITVLDYPTISGQIRDSNGNGEIGNVYVRIYDSLGNYKGYVRSDSQGRYTITAAESGDYYLTFSNSEYQLELFNNIICNQVCDFNSGTTIALAYNQHLQNVDVSLQKNAVISGSVIEADTSLPITQSIVYVIDELGSVVRQLNLYSTHLWEIPIRVGDYYVVGTDLYTSFDNYLATKYSNGTCLSSELNSCDLVNGTLISHSSVDTLNILLQREKGARINGVVTDINNQPLPGVSLVVFYASGNQRVKTDYISTDALGQFSTYQLGNSEYKIVAEKQSHLVQLYSNVGCTSVFQCDFNLGNIIVINNLTDVNGVDFQLTPKSTISGRVVDYNNNPISGANIELKGGSFNQDYFAYTNNSGEYQIDNISSGNDYKLIVRGSNYNNSTLYSEVYNNIQCDDFYCNGENYTPIVVGINQQLNIDFELNYKGKVNFDFISNSTNQVDNGIIVAVDSLGNQFDSFIFNGYAALPEGDYYFYYGSNSSNDGNIFVNKVYGGGNCFNSCDATSGTLVHVSDNSEQNFTMNLDQYFYIDVTSEIGYVFATVYEINPLNSFGVTVNNNYRKISIRDLDNRYLKFSKTGYFSQIYNGINCEPLACDVTQGNLIVPQLNSSISINYNPISIASISGKITGLNNIPLAGKIVTLFTNINSNYGLNVTTNSNGEFSFDAVESGDYYLKVKSGDDYYVYDKYMNTYYGNIPCDVNDCSGLGISPITINASNYLTGYDIQMADRGSISGEGIQNIFNELVSIKLDFYRVENGSLNYMRSISIDNGLLVSFYLPEGEYKLIARVNGQSLSTAYPSTQCEVNTSESCALLAQSLFVTNSNNTHFSSFLIHQYGVLKVKFFDSVDNTPIINGKIDLYRSNGDLVSNYSTGSNANEIRLDLSESGLYKAYLYETGSYYPYTSKYIAKLYNGVDCESGIGFDCLFSQGQDFLIETDSIYAIDVYLSPKPKLKVDVLNEVTNKKISNSRIKIYDSYGVLVYEDYSPNLGDSYYIESLGAGEYYAVVYINNSYLITGYPNVVCNDFNNLSSCAVGVSTFSLQQGDNPKQINIRTILQQGLNGYVIDANTNQPIDNIILDFWDNTGNHRGSTTTSSNGGFSKYFSSGDYFLSTDTNNDYVNEVYKDIPCTSAAILGNCDVTRGQITTIPSNNSSPIVINIELENPNSIFTSGFE